MQEIFKDVPNYEGLYQVSNLGNVKSLKYSKHRILKPNKSKRGNGYLFVGLFKDKKQKKIYIHQLVAMAFLNHKANGYELVVNHKDFNSLNNNLNNLEIITQRKNTSKRNTSIKYTSKYTGVSWHKNTQKWVAQIYKNKKNIFLGYYEKEIEASKSYNKELNLK